MGGTLLTTIPTITGMTMPMTPTGTMRTVTRRIPMRRIPTRGMPMGPIAAAGTIIRMSTPTTTMPTTITTTLITATQRRSIGTVPVAATITAEA